MEIIKKECRDLMSLAWPMIGSYTLSHLMPVVDSMMLGHLGAHALASMGLALPLISFSITFSIGVLSIAMPLIGEAYVQKSDRQIERVAISTIWVALILAIFLGLVFLFSKPLFELCGQSADLIPDAVRFIKAYSIGMPAFLIYIALRQLLEGCGKTRPAFWASCIGVLLNIVLDFGLIYGKWGFPRLGIFGAGLATSLVCISMCLFMMLMVSTASDFKNIHLRQNFFQNHWKLIFEQLCKGLPVAGMFVSEVGIFAFATLLIGTFGEKSLAAHQIALNVASLTFMIPLGLGHAVSIRSSHYLGLKDLVGIRRIGNVSFWVALIVMSLPAAALIFFPQSIARLYTKEPEVIAISSSLMCIAGFFQWVDGSQTVSSALLRGLKDTRIPLLNTIFSFCLIGLGSILYFVYPMKLAEKGVWYGLTLTLGFAALLHRWRFKYLMKSSFIVKAVSS